ncbi:hypothetical protein [Brevundimonas naejangsanensis]|uniref:hypothetical protein n=1 Tax=Brevundimonas naejangsanensis TaxID=588932 RepID=UPI0026F3615F|nr:hypothetical protein [Brevundimonas naejangsanensis]
MTRPIYVLNADADPASGGEIGALSAASLAWLRRRFVVVGTSSSDIVLSSCSQSLSGIDQGGALFSHGGDGGDPEGRIVDTSVGEGGQEALGDDAGFVNRVAVERGGAPVDHEVQGGQGEVFDSQHTASEKSVHEAVLKLARLAAHWPLKLKRVRRGGQS